MLMWNKRMWKIWVGALVVAPLALGASAAADTVYSWRTEDGAYAFTDDLQAIPARYRSQVKTRQMTGLEKNRSPQTLRHGRGALALQAWRQRAPAAKDRSPLPG